MNSALHWAHESSIFCLISVSDHISSLVITLAILQEYEHCIDGNWLHHTTVIFLQLSTLFLKTLLVHGVYTIRLHWQFIEACESHYTASERNPGLKRTQTDTIFKKIDVMKTRFKLKIYMIRKYFKRHVYLVKLSAAWDFPSKMAARGIFLIYAYFTKVLFCASHAQNYQIATTLWFLHKFILILRGIL
jgi:hypothetical protein